MYRTLIKIKCTLGHFKSLNTKHWNYTKYILFSSDAQSCPTLCDPMDCCFIDYAKDFDCVDHNKSWKILREMVIPDHLTCLLRNLYAGQEATVRTGHGTTDSFQIGQGVQQGCILSPFLFKLYAKNMRKAGLEEAKAGIKIAGEISITSDMQVTPP